MLIMHIIKKKLYKTFLVNIKKNHEKNNNNLTVFEPKHPLRVCYGTDAIPLSQTAIFKVGLKDSTLCLDLAYFNPKIKQKNIFLGISG